MYSYHYGVILLESKFYVERGGTLIPDSKPSLSFL